MYRRACQGWRSRRKLKNLAFDHQVNVKFYHYHLKDDFTHFYGSHSELLEKHGIELKNRKGYKMNKYMILVVVDLLQSIMSSFSKKDDTKK